MAVKRIVRPSNPQDTFTALKFRMDSGEAVELKVGSDYDFTSGEIARLSRYVELGPPGGGGGGGVVGGPSIFNEFVRRFDDNGWPPRGTSLGPRMWIGPESSPPPEFDEAIGDIFFRNEPLAIPDIAGLALAYDEVVDDESTASSSAVDLTTDGPLINLTVPVNGLVQLYCATDIKGDGTNNARVLLADDGADLGAAGVTTLQRSTNTFGTVRAVPGSNNGTSARNGAFVMFAPTPGERTYKLRYSTAGGTGNFKNRRLWGRVLV